MKAQWWNRLDRHLYNKIDTAYGGVHSDPYDPTLDNVNITGFPKYDTSLAICIERILVEELTKLRT